MVEVVVVAFSGRHFMHPALGASEALGVEALVALG
jgi:hypothetical protein